MRLPGARPFLGAHPQAALALSCRQPLLARRHLTPRALHPVLSRLVLLALKPMPPSRPPLHPPMEAMMARRLLLELRLLPSATRARSSRCVCVPERDRPPLSVAGCTRRCLTAWPLGCLACGLATHLAASPHPCTQRPAVTPPPHSVLRSVSVVQILPSDSVDSPAPEGHGSSNSSSAAFASSSSTTTTMATTTTTSASSASAAAASSSNSSASASSVANASASASAASKVIVSAYPWPSPSPLPSPSPAADPSGSAWNGGSGADAPAPAGNTAMSSWASSPACSGAPDADALRVSDG